MQNTLTGRDRHVEIRRATLDSCHQADGVVVVVDVLRAFTTAAFAFAGGAEEILLVSTVEQAFDLRKELPDHLLMGEVGGLPIEGFDLPNSPTIVAKTDLLGIEPRRRHGLVFKSAAFDPEDKIDSRPEAAIDDLLESGNIGPPIFRVVPDEVVVAPGDGGRVI